MIANELINDYYIKNLLHSSYTYQEQKLILKVLFIRFCLVKKVIIWFVICSMLFKFSIIFIIYEIWNNVYWTANHKILKTFDNLEGVWLKVIYSKLKSIN